MGAEAQTPGIGDLEQLLCELRQAGEKPDRALLDRVKAHGQFAVRPLIAMAIDERLLNAHQDSPEVWAPMHAIQILGELGAPEAVEPLLPLFEWDDSLAWALPEAFGGIGEPALAVLHTLLFDRSKDIWVRARAGEALSQIAQRHPTLHSQVVSALTARLDPKESRTPQDEILNGLVICDLLDLQAVESAPAIRRAFAEDHVDTSIIGLDWALQELGLPRESRRSRPPEQQGMQLRLLCTACDYEREHNVGTVFYDLGTKERRERGEETPYSEVVITRRITCPKCGAVDQYELAGHAYLALTAEVLRRTMAHQQGGPREVADEEDGDLVFRHFTLTDGREMHPLEARDMYREQVGAEPERADLRLRYGNVLRFLGYPDEARQQYQAALRSEPTCIEAYHELGYMALDAGNPAEARQMFERVLTLAPQSRLPRKDVEEYVEAAREELGGPPAVPSARRWGDIGRQTPLPPELWRRAAGREAAMAMPRQTVRTAPKVGRNDPCPCGSGKKYKKCHGR